MVLKLIILILALALGCYSQPTTSQAVYVQAFSNLATAPTTSSLMPNIGQSTHMVLVIVKDNGGGLCANPWGDPEIHFQISWDNITYIDELGISDTDFFETDDLGTVTGFSFYPGTYPFVRLRVEQFDTVNCLLDIWYSGSVGSNGAVRAQTGVAKTGTDGIADISLDFFGQSGNTRPTRIQQMIFNGQTWDRQLRCDRYTSINVGVNSTSVILGGSVDNNIRVCSIFIASAVNGTIQFQYGTGANCGTGTFNLTTAVPVLASEPISLGGSIGAYYILPEEQSFCITTAGGANARGGISYEIY